jgi:hypothetical protein
MTIESDNDLNGQPHRAHDFTQPGRVANVVSDLDERRILAGLIEALKSHPAG